MQKGINEAILVQAAVQILAQLGLRKLSLATR
jgi:hypothetical protein